MIGYLPITIQMSVVKYFFPRGGSLAFYHHLQCFRAENCEMECRFVGLRVLVDEFKGGGSSPQWEDLGSIGAESLTLVGRVPLVVGEDHCVEHKLQPYFMNFPF